MKRSVYPQPHWQNTAYLHQFVGIDLVTVIIDELIGIHPAYHLPGIIVQLAVLYGNAHILHMGRLRSVLTMAARTSTSVVGDSSEYALSTLISSFPSSTS